MKEDERGHIYKTHQGLLERNRSQTEIKHSRASDGQAHRPLLLKEQKSLKADDSKAEERQGAGARGLDPEGNKI